MTKAIVYYSRHHGNTKQLLDTISREYAVDLIDISNVSNIDFSKYSAVGLASGIYYGKFHKSILNFAKKILPKNKKVFFIYTYGNASDSHTKAITEVVKEKNATILGEYGCFGYDTFGPLKLMGGLKKGHPNLRELHGALEFYESLLHLEA